MGNELGFLDVIPAQLVDPEGSEFYSRYIQAIAMKQEKRFNEVESLLMPSVEPPSIYHGHYRELFVAFRHRIKALEKNSEHQAIVALLLKMIRLNNEMLQKMSDHWSPIHGVYRPPSYFTNYSKINNTDLKKLVKHATALNDVDAVSIAENYHSK